MVNLQKVLFFGSPLWDNIAEVSESFLLKHNLKPNDAIMDPKNEQKVLKDLIKEDAIQEQMPGGSSQNSARACSWVLKHGKFNDAPADFVAFTGCVREDNEGREMEQACREEGVDVCYQKLSETDPTPTGTCAVCVNGKNRSLVASLGAAQEFKFSELNVNLKDYDMFYIEGFFGGASEETIREVAKFADANGKKLMLNMSAPFVPAAYKKLWTDIFESLDYLFANESEIAAYAKANNIKYASLEELAVTIANRASKKSLTVVITQGADPTIVAVTGDKKATLHAIDKIDPREIKDTNGAGDSFVGGFVAGLMNGLSTPLCARLGALAAKHVIQRVGAKYEEPSKDEAALLRLFSLDHNELIDEALEQRKAIEALKTKLNKPDYSLLWGVLIGLASAGVLVGGAAVVVKRRRLSNANKTEAATPV